MNFNDWRLERLRSRLNAYRFRPGNKGKARPWKAILCDILTLPETAHVFPKDGSEPEFKEEALRRFGNGESDSTPEKLEDIKIFLIQKGMLTEQELEDYPYNIDTALSLHRHLASVDPAARDLLNKIPARYVAYNRTPVVVERIAIDCELDESGDYLRLEERYEQILDPQAGVDPEELKGYRRDSRKTLDQKRVGFGYLCTQSKTLHFFIWGANRNDLISYVQIPPFHDFSAEYSILLVRNGAYLEKRLLASENPDSPEFMNNIFRFNVSDEAPLGDITEDRKIHEVYTT